MQIIIYRLWCHFAQLYGDMVVDEVSLGVLSNYNKVTLLSHELVMDAWLHELVEEACLTVAEGGGAKSDLSDIFNLQTVFCTRGETEDGCLYVRLERTHQLSSAECCFMHYLSLPYLLMFIISWIQMSDPYDSESGDVLWGYLLLLKVCALPHILLYAGGRYCYA